jgi:hypothetical protein
MSNIPSEKDNLDYPIVYRNGAEVAQPSSGQDQLSDLMRSVAIKVLQGVVEKGQVSIFSAHATGERTQEIFTVGFSSEELPFLRATVSRSHVNLPHLTELGEDEPKIEIDLKEFDEPLGIGRRALKLVQTWGMKQGEFDLTYSVGDNEEPEALMRQNQEASLLKQILEATVDDNEVVMRFGRPYTHGDSFSTSGDAFVREDGSYGDDHVAYWVRDVIEGNVSPGLPSVSQFELVEKAER